MQTLFYNGIILTMEDPRPVDALLIEDDLIHAVGSLHEVSRYADKDAKAVDLQGAALLPAFLDPHSHFAAAANTFLQVSLAECTSFQEIAGAIRRHIEENHLAKGVWVRAGGYDHNALCEKKHPDAALLDTVAPDNPVILQHASGHMGVFNSCALRLLEVPAREDAIAGGRIAVSGGVPTGYLEENAFLTFQRKIPIPSGQEFLQAFEKAQNWYLQNGITYVQDGMLDEKLIPLYESLLDSGLLKLDVAAYPSFEGAPAVRTHFDDLLPEKHLHLGGYKMFLDGSPQGRTAWMRTPYQGSPDYRGYGTLRDEEVYDHICQAVREHRQLLAHCNGDAACEQYISMAEKAVADGYDVASVRPVMIHAQLLGRDQLQRMKAVGLMPSFFVAHVYHWGDIHIENFGFERACAISPTASALKAGLRFTFHQDTPVIPPDMLETIWCAVSRTTKKGVVLGEDERISPYEALQAVTCNAAYQYFEESRRGTLLPGKKADLVLLSKDPVSCSAEELRSIRVLATYKDGKALYRR